MKQEREDGGLCIMTALGWRPLGGPMPPVPSHGVWWRVGCTSDEYERQFFDRQGRDLRTCEPGTWGEQS